MTEQEAKTKWCPMVRTPSSAIENQNTGINRESAEFNCIASDCMLWVWDFYGSVPIDYPTVGHCGLCR